MNAFAFPGPQRLFARGLSKRFGKRQVVDGVDFEVRRGEVVGLLGPNGAGKTTTFQMAVGLVPPDAGQVHLDEVELTALPLFRRARLGLGYLPQEASIFRKLTVRENLLAVLETRKLSRAERHARAESLLAEFGLGAVADAPGESLSGGERRRAEIARSLVPEPAFMLFDEPFAGVDPITVHELAAVIGQLVARGLGVLLTDHNVRDALRICHRAYLLCDGKVLEEGRPEALAKSERARAVYLGSQFSL